LFFLFLFFHFDLAQTKDELRQEGRCGRPRVVARIDDLRMIITTIIKIVVVTHPTRGERWYVRLPQCNGLLEDGNPGEIIGPGPTTFQFAEFFREALVIVFEQRRGQVTQPLGRREHSIGLAVAASPAGGEVFEVQNFYGVRRLGRDAQDGNRCRCWFRLLVVLVRGIYRWCKVVLQGSGVEGSRQQDHLEVVSPFVHE